MNNHPISLINLAEAIILQSIEDLWVPLHKKESIDFFRGEGFRLAAEVAEMSAVDKRRLLLILRRWEKKVMKVNSIRHSHAQ